MHKIKLECFYLSRHFTATWEIKVDINSQCSQRKKIFSRAFRTSEQNINVIPIIERQHLRQISSALL